MQLQRSAFLSSILFYLQVIAVSVPPIQGPVTCVALSGPVSLNTTSPDKLPRTPCYLSKSSVAIIFTETSYPLAFRAIISIFAIVAEDAEDHPNDADLMTSSTLWYPGDYPYNNTELFVRITSPMRWGEWRNASIILAFWYTRFSAVSLDFEVKGAGGGRAKALASGRISLFDQETTGEAIGVGTA